MPKAMELMRVVRMRRCAGQKKERTMMATRMNLVWVGMSLR
jgi:hypothetical protein